MASVFSHSDTSSQKSLGYIARVVVTCAFLVLIGRLYFFQVIEGERYQFDSQRNRIRTVTIEAPRCLILDRYGVTLAENRISYTIATIPIEITDTTITRLGVLINRNPKDLREKIRDRTLNRFNPVVLQRDASFEIVSRVEEHLIELPGVTVQVEPTRLYPLQSVASHILGYVTRSIESPQHQTIIQTDSTVKDSVRISPKTVIEAYLERDQINQPVARGTTPISLQDITNP